MDPYYHKLIDNGIKVVINNIIQPYYKSVQFKFPKSKKKRIRAKWRKRSDNFKLIYVDDFFYCDGVLFMNQQQFDKVFSTLPAA